MKKRVLWLVVFIALFEILVFALVRALDTHGKENTIWNAVIFTCVAAMLALYRSKRKSRFILVATITSFVIAGVFAAYYYLL